MNCLAVKISDFGLPHRLRRNEMLFRQDDPAVQIFSVLRGRLRLERILENGIPVTVSVVRAPALLAEAALFSENYHCSAIAETDCKLVRVDKEGFSS